MAAAKFHSAAITADGQLLTWGWGRGGRLGEPQQMGGVAEGGWQEGEQGCWAATATVATDVVAALLGLLLLPRVSCSLPRLTACCPAPHLPAGHPDAHVHSGEGAVIAPLAVAGLGRRAVVAVAAAKHHTVLCTSAGEVWTFGSNRHGQLGYAVDTQPTPRRVSSLRQRIVAVAAANKHSVAVAAGGEVFTWGCNVLGQVWLGRL